MIHEFDDVVLCVNLPDAPLFEGGRGLHAGDEGTVVDLVPGCVGAMVEFFRNGESVAVVGVRLDQITLVPAPLAVTARSAD